MPCASTATSASATGAAGVGKTLSARRYARWDVAEPLLVGWGPRHPSDTKVYAAVAHPDGLLHAHVCCPFRELRDDIAQLVTRGRLHRRAPPPRGASVRGDFPTLAELLIVDEAERLSTAALEHLRDVFDRPASA